MANLVLGFGRLAVGAAMVYQANKATDLYQQRLESEKRLDDELTKGIRAIGDVFQEAFDQQKKPIQPTPPQPTPPKQSK